MYKRLFTIFLVSLTILILAGCQEKSSKPELEVMPNDDSNTISITATKAGISGIGGAGITIAEGQQLVIFRDDEPAGVDASVDEILHTNDAPALDVTIKTAGTTEHPLQPGEYTLFVNVLEKATGTIILSAK